MDDGCAICGGELPQAKHRPNSRPRTVCDKRECLRAANAYGARRMNAIKAARRAAQPPPTEKRCPMCGEVKPLTGEFWYVTKRDKETGAVLRYYSYCKPCKQAYQRSTRDVERDAERHRARYWERRAQMTPEELAAERARGAARGRRRRRQSPERVRAARQRYQERLRRDPARWRKRLERNRIAYRLRRERQGYAINQRAAIRPLPERGRELPAAPLAEAVEALIGREQRLLNGDAPPEDMTRAKICERLGVSVRNHTAYLGGQRALVRAEIVDRVLTRSSLLWWEVYDEERWPEAHRQAAEVFG